MSARSKLASVDFWEDLMAVEGRIGRSGIATCFDAFSDISDELFALLLLHDFEDFPRIRALLPKWPSDSFWSEHIGQMSPNDSLKEAAAFWTVVKRDYARLANSQVSKATVIDFGAGWGRISRLFSKDVPRSNLYAVDPNAELLLNAEECGVQCQFCVSDWHSNGRLDLPPADLIFSYGVFTHASPDLSRNMFERIAEISKPGALLSLTVRPGAMLYADAGEALLFSDDQIVDARAKVMDGRNVFLPYDGNVDWGVAVAPKAWLSRVAQPWFSLVSEQPLLQNWTHKLVHFKRN